MDCSQTPLKGADLIAAHLKTLPDAPGVYRMLNAAGEVLYVGKAKSLKKRVSSYARGGLHSERLTRMVAETAEMIFVTTASETEALLLESNLIKRLKPRYNVSYRDDKSFPNILLRQDHPFPQLLKHRGAKTVEGIYFGPFASIAPSTPCSALFCCVLVRIRCSTAARDPAFCSRSSAAARLA
jgi:excinuclease ABC subunit C